MSKLFHISYLHFTSIWSPQSIGSCPHGFGKYSHTCKGEWRQLCCLGRCWNIQILSCACTSLWMTQISMHLYLEFCSTNFSQGLAFFPVPWTLIALNLGPWISENLCRGESLSDLSCGSVCSALFGSSLSCMAGVRVTPFHALSMSVHAACFPPNSLLACVEKSNGIN